MSSLIWIEYSARLWMALWMWAMAPISILLYVYMCVYSQPAKENRFRKSSLWKFHFAVSPEISISHLEEAEVL